MHIIIIATYNMHISIVQVRNIPTATATLDTAHEGWCLVYYVLQKKTTSWCLAVGVGVYCITKGERCMVCVCALITRP